jgi:hypothetical protein
MKLRAEFFAALPEGDRLSQNIKNLRRDGAGEGK